MKKKTVIIFKHEETLAGEVFLGYVGDDVKKGERNNPFAWRSVRIGEVDGIAIGPNYPVFANKEEILATGATLVNRFGDAISW
ncbi:MAG: hypothetical protein US57_C0002G0006 [Candidatus Moranbacteria bacterium GW2011_GWC2_37_73]|nr:MAG: hypothetical protein UR95_C0002G0104 [Parcubacteria group bacterium GW2011_GWC1_36_108]KKQ01053.1 MAG: hypothetical protein US09_C0003G0053 [Candidatus Moranbacteria bacterium GW2011_GWD1_36_198]KKQ02455.1 MAG: hypothetical protein US10_C0001G0053 [Candidatus Moranbacteria bacterium GW2011_GWD2_36_198]KKQ40299.1 MAG: hypothetical protein US57_C0002G0006 [Candidatus Moranbacteria bacterium GW2011_GWC2_37_73]HAS00266.1 hypothetical protein [Candidatus Moranbacteria bacterium]